MSVNKYYIEPNILPEIDEACAACPFARVQFKGKGPEPLSGVAQEDWSLGRCLCALALTYIAGETLRAQGMIRTHPHLYDCLKYYEFNDVGLILPARME